MRFVKAAFIIASLLAGSSAPARAETPSAAFLKRVDELVRWIAANSAYPAVLEHAPVFVFLAPAQVRHSFAGSLMGYAEKNDVKAAQLRETIFLPNTFALGRDDYILLHELVHFLQYMQQESGRKFSCMEEREREAYRLQIAFVHETGVGETPNDMFMLMLRCDIR